jgi:hypothetical protein
MDFGAGTLLIGGAIGLALALFGVRMLVTGQAPAATSRAFRTVRDAGLYHLLFGIALGLLVLGTKLPGAATALVSTVVAVALVGVAVARFRPRRARPQDAEEEKR